MRAWVLYPRVSLDLARPPSTVRKPPSQCRRSRYLSQYISYLIPVIVNPTIFLDKARQRKVK